MDPVLDALWEAARADFAADAANAAFIEHCRRSEQLPEAARRYREAKQAGADVERRLAAITAIALREVDLRKSAAAPRDFMRHRVMIAFAAAVLAAALYGLWVSLRGQ